MTERAQDRVWLLGLLALGAVGVATRFHDQLGLTGDNAVYLLLARNLVSGQPYDNAGFPWGYPALLAPGVALFGPEHLLAAIPWLKLLSVAAFAIAIVCWYRLFRLRHPPLLAGGAVALFICNDSTLAHANDLMTELPYLAATGAALLVWQAGRWGQGRTRRAGGGDQPSALPANTNPVSRSLLPAFALLLLLILPYYLRTIGLTLLVAVLVVLVVRRQGRAALGWGVALAAGAAPWIIFTRTAGLPNYLDDLFQRDPYQPELGNISSASEWVQVFVTRLGDYVNPVWPTVILPPPSGEAGHTLLAGALLGLIVIGYGRRLARGIALPEVYAFGFLFTLGSWPWVGGRFLLPLLPLLFHYGLEAVAWAGEIVGRAWGQRAGAVPARLQMGAQGALVIGLLALALPNVIQDGRVAAGTLRYWQTGNTATLPDMDPAWQQYFTASAWLGAHTPPGSVSLSRKSSLTAIYAGRPSLLIPLIPPADYPAFLAAHHVAYLIDDAFLWSRHTTAYLRPAMAADPGRYHLVYTTPPPETRVWAVGP